MTFYQNYSNCSAPLNTMAARAINREKMTFPAKPVDGFKTISLEGSVGDRLLKLLKPLCSVEEDGHQS